MLTLTYESGQRMERQFYGVISNEEDIGRFLAELRIELTRCEGKPIYCEIWKEAEPRKELNEDSFPRKEVVKSASHEAVKVA